MDLRWRDRLVLIGGNGAFKLALTCDWPFARPALTSAARNAISRPVMSRPSRDSTRRESALAWGGLGRVGPALQRALVPLGAPVAHEGRPVGAPAPLLLVFRALALAALRRARGAAPFAVRVAYRALLACRAVRALVAVSAGGAAVAVVAAVALELAGYARRVEPQLACHVGQRAALRDVVLDGNPHLEGDVDVVPRCRHGVTAFPGGGRSGRFGQATAAGAVWQILGPEGPRVCRRLAAPPSVTDLAQSFLH